MNKRGKLKRTLIILTVNILPIVLFLGIGEIYLRRLGLEPYQRTFPGQYENEPGIAWVKTDQELGWTVDPDFLPAEINRQGFRDLQDFDNLAAAHDKTRVMILGDSFTFGTHLAIEENYPSLLQTDLTKTHEIFNLGVPGWGIDQMVLAYDRFHETIDPDIVVLAFIDDDFERVLEAFRRAEKLNKPSFDVIGDELIVRQPASAVQLSFGKTVGKSVLASYVLREIIFVTEAKPVVQHLLADLERQVSESGAQLVLVRITTQDQFKKTQIGRRRLVGYAEMFTQAETLYLEPAEVITAADNWDRALYFSDGHLNEAGNRVLADYLLAELFGE